MSKHEITTNELMDFLQEHMVTKDDLLASETGLRKEIRASEHRILDLMDDKLADLKGDLIVLIRKGNTKLVALIELLQKKYGMSEKDARALLQLQPFPQS